MTDPATKSPWEAHSARWHKVGYPLRPSPYDLAIFQRELASCASERRHVQALLLGITAEITALDWPENSALLAVDASRAMLQRHWAGPHGIASLPVLGRWEQMPLLSDSIDLVIADGSLSILAGADSLTNVIRHLAAVVRKEGRMVLRSFVRPQIQEQPQQVFAAMQRGEIGSFDVFKWRLVMSLHNYSSRDGVVLQTVYRAFREVVPRSEELAQQLGWPVESIETIESYRNATGRYYFPTLAYLRELLSEHFAELSCHVPDYELGPSCPFLILRHK